MGNSIHKLAKRQISSLSQPGARIRLKLLNKDCQSESLVISCKSFLKLRIKLVFLHLTELVGDGIIVSAFMQRNYMNCL